MLNARVILLVVAQRNDQHIDVDRVDELTCRRHQLAPEVLVMTTDDQVHIVFLNRINQHLAQVAAAAQGFGDWVTRVGGQFSQCVMGLFGDALLHIAKIHVNQPGVEIGIVYVDVNQRNFCIVGASH